MQALARVRDVPAPDLEGASCARPYLQGLLRATTEKGLNMSFTVTLSAAALFALAGSAALFVIATIICAREKLFSANDSYEIGALFGLCVYALVWLVPSLLSWAVWATWWRAV